MLEAKLKELVVAALGQVPQSAGVAEATILQAERNLGARLPPPVRAFYATVGGLPAVTESHHQFVPIESLAVSNGGLIICREHQDKMFWALLDKDLALSDPPVVQGQHDVNRWDHHCAAVSVFLVNFCCWQLVNSMPSIGSTQLADGTVREVRRHLRVVSATFGFNMLSFVGVETSLLASALLDIDRLYVGARSDIALQQFQKTSGIELDLL